MVRNKWNEYLTLFKRIAILVVIGIGVYLLYRWIGPGSGETDEFTIDGTPLRVEQIRSIVELNTIDFRDEVVVDSVEFYKSSSEALSGAAGKLQDFVIDMSPIKRRLTMIIKGELLYGVDLKRKEMKISSTDSTLTVMLPEPRLLTVSVSPDNTEIFIENGKWSDREKQQLQVKAKNKMIASGESLNLREKAKYPLEKLLRKLIRTEKKLIIRYY